MTNILTALKPIGYGASLGDSRPARFYQSLGNNFGFSGYTAFTCAQARTGHRIKMVYNGGNSGDQSDQMLARVAATIASGAGTLIIRIGVNDINNAGVGYTTVNTVGPNQGVAVTTANVALICFQNIQWAAQQFIRAGGQKVLIFLECGAEVFGTAQIAAVINLNQRLREFAEAEGRVVLWDAWQLMHDPAASTTSTLRFKSGYAAEAAGSGTHESNKGAYFGGKDLAPILAANWPAVPYLPSDVNEVTAITTNNLLLNPLFMTTSGGTGSGSNGITGTVPGSWTADRTGGGSTQTAVISTGTPSDGSPGTECIMACTFGGAGDIIRIRQDAVIANISIGDFLEGVGSVVIDSGATSLAGVQMDLQYADGTTTWNLTDLKPLDNNAIPTDGVTYFLKTPPYPVTVKGGGAFMSMRLYAIGSGAGTATVRWRTIQARKRFAL
jgi:hypothetical protein